MLAAIWVVVKLLDAGFRRRICPAMLVRINFAIAGFKSLPILHGLGSLMFEGLPMARTTMPQQTLSSL